MKIPFYGVEDISNYYTILHDFIIILREYTLSFLNYLLDTVEHFILSCFFYIVICILLYFFITWRWFPFDREIRNFKRLLFVTAHPDDECMFFGPTIQYYTKKKNCAIYLMCLSTGKNYGMGEIRKRELYNACHVLGIPQSNIIIHSHTLLPDAMDVRWPTELVSTLISHHIDSLNITAVITFDRYGISYHNNHSSIYYAVANLILDKQLPKGCGVYVLETTNILRKYWLFLDIPISFILSRFRYLSSFEDRSVIHSAMKQHKSQIVWFRRIYMFFSRYMLINSLQQMNLVDIELDLELDE